MQNGFYQVRVPDATDYWIEMVKCRHACPVHTDACGYVTAIAEGRYETAYRIARAHISRDHCLGSCNVQRDSPDSRHTGHPTGD